MNIQSDNIKDDEQLLITQQQENVLEGEASLVNNNQLDYQPDVSQIQQDIYEAIITPPQSHSGREQGSLNQISPVKTIVKQPHQGKDIKAHPVHRIAQQISAHTVEFQSQSSLQSVPRGKKHSVISQSTSPIPELEDNPAPFIPKPPLVNHIPITMSSPSLRIYNGGKKKRVKSDKEDLQFFRSPYHEKKYLGNQIYPPEPIKIQGYSDSQQDLFTFKPHINQPAQMPKNNKAYQILDGKNMDIEFIEYLSSPIVVKNSFINNPSCMHNLVNKKVLRKTNSTNFVFLRTINLQENRKNIFAQANLFEKKHQATRSQSIQPLPSSSQLQPLIQSKNNNSNNKSSIKEHSKNSYSMKGQNTINYSHLQGSFSQKAQSQFKLPPFASSLENMNNFSIAKSNLIKYVNTMKL